MRSLHRVGLVTAAALLLALGLLGEAGLLAQSADKGGGGRA